jgi:hypothetical protein
MQEECLKISYQCTLASDLVKNHASSMRRHWEQKGCLISPPSRQQRGRWRRFEPAQQKGLRDRNSPTCTLSQNGYGDSMWQPIIVCNLTIRMC